MWVNHVRMEQQSFRGLWEREGGLDDVGGLHVERAKLCGASGNYGASGGVEVGVGVSR